MTLYQLRCKECNYALIEIETFERGRLTGVSALCDKCKLQTKYNERSAKVSELELIDPQQQTLVVGPHEREMRKRTRGTK